MNKWSAAYTNELGVHDGIELGHKNPNRSFSRESTEERDRAYFQGLEVGIAHAQRNGLDMRCLVRWDNPGFDTPACCKPAVALGVAEYPSSTHIIPLCARHAIQAEQANAKVSTPKGFPYAWAIKHAD